MGALMAVNPVYNDGREGRGYSIADPLVNDSRGCSVESTRRVESIWVAPQRMWINGRSKLRLVS